MFQPLANEAIPYAGSSKGAQVQNSATVPTDEQRLLDSLGCEFLAGSGFEAEVPDPVFVPAATQELVRGED